MRLCELFWAYQSLRVFWLKIYLTARLTEICISAPLASDTPALFKFRHGLRPDLSRVGGTRLGRRDWA